MYDVEIAQNYNGIYLQFGLTSSRTLISSGVIVSIASKFSLSINI